MTESEPIIYTSSKGRNLATLKNQNGWESWKVKARAFLGRRKLLTTIQGEEPEELEIRALTFTEKNEWTTAREAENAERVQRGEEAMDDDDPPQNREETPQELAVRKDTWQSKNETLWSELVECADEDALNAVREAPEGDGRAAWLLLIDRFDRQSVTSKFMLILELFDLAQGSKPVAEHVSSWKDTLRRLRSTDVTFGAELISVVFLKSLNGKFSQFRTYSLMNDDITPEKLYIDAQEYEKANGGDEAHTSHTAMVGEERGANKRYRGEGKDGNTNGAKSARQDDWQCPACGFSNRSTRHRCNSCSGNRPKGKGDGKGGRTCKFGANCTKRATCTYAHPAVSSGKQGDITRLKAQLAQQSAKIQHAKDTAEALDLDVDLGLLATERVEITERGQAMTVKENKTVRWKVDSGASSHFAGADVHLTNEKPYNAIVDTADGGEIIIKHKGTFSGKTTDSNKEMTFEAKQSHEFLHNLFSSFQAAKEGCKTVLEWDNSFIEHKPTGTILPLSRTNTGWELPMQPTTATKRSRGQAMETDEHSSEDTDEQTSEEPPRVKPRVMKPMSK